MVLHRLLCFTFLFLVSNGVFALSEYPFYEKQYVGRVYSSESFSHKLMNQACTPTYQEISLRGKIPVARNVRDFRYEGLRTPAFYHPYLREPKEFLAMSWNTKSESSRSVIKIPVSIPIPTYATSLGILIGGDGFATNTIYLVVDENGKERIYSLKSLLLKKTYMSYILSLKKSLKRNLKAIYIKGDRHTAKTLSWSPERKQAFIGPIFFSSIKISEQIQEVQTQENILTPISFTSGPTSSDDPPHTQNYSVEPAGLWHKDDTLFLNFKDLKLGTLEVYVYLKDRVTRNFLLRQTISGFHNRNDTCVKVSLPQDVINYQQKHSGGVYFGIAGVRWIPSSNEEVSPLPKLTKAFFQRENWQLYAYPLDR